MRHRYDSNQTSISHIQNSPHAVRKLHGSVFNKNRSYCRLKCHVVGSKDFRVFLLLWPWPWLADLHIKTWHRRSQDFVWGVLFLTKKVDDLFLVVALKEHLNTPPNLTRPAKTVLKIDSCSGWGGALRVLGVHLHIFPVNYAWKNFFTALGGAGAPTAPPGYAYETWPVSRKDVPADRRWTLYVNAFESCRIAYIQTNWHTDRCLLKYYDAASWVVIKLELFSRCFGPDCVWQSILLCFAHSPSATFLL